MLIKIELLALISKKDLITAYFFERGNKIIFAKDFGTHQKSDKTLITGMLEALKAEILCGEIVEDSKNSYLHIITGSKELIKVEITLKNLVVLTKLDEIPVFIEHELLFRNGIMVTKELIEDTLQH